MDFEKAKSLSGLLSICSKKYLTIARIQLYYERTLVTGGEIAKTEEAQICSGAPHC